MLTEDQIHAILAKMVVPAHKLDVTKPTVVKWLLDNLRTRNLTHNSYQSVMQALIDLALAKKWCKKSELHEYEASISDDAMREGLARWREQRAIHTQPAWSPAGDPTHRPSRPPLVDPVVVKVFGADAKPMNLADKDPKRTIIHAPTRPGISTSQVLRSATAGLALSAGLAQAQDTKAADSKGPLSRDRFTR